MYDFVVLWLCWLLFCFPSFFMNRTNYRAFYMIGILSIIILLPYQVTLNGFPFSVSHLFIVIWGSIAIIKLKFTWRNYSFILFISYAYVIYFLWRITSPILDEFTFLLIGLLGSISINQLIKIPFPYRIYMWLSGISYGHLFYSFICHSYHLHEVRNTTYYLILLLSVLLFLSIQLSWKYWLMKIENWIQILENKKRWNL